MRRDATLFLVLLAMSLAAAEPPANTPPAFTKRTLSKDFVAEGCTAADFNRDGATDIAAGRFIWLGPEYATRVAFTPERKNPDGTSREPYRADTGYSDYFEQFAHDFTGDGWPDILVYGIPGAAASVFVNPATRDLATHGDWQRSDIFDVANGESPDLVDLTGDGKPELLCHTDGRFGFAEIDWSNPPASTLAKARFRPITAKSAEGDAAIHRYTHGYGAGDVNGDGRIDILTNTGWYEQPADRSTDAPWTFHAANFGEGGAQMYALDANGDGRSDIVTSIRAHGYGISWFAQNADRSFAERAILGRTAQENANGAGFSQPHALRIADINQDGLPDIVSGKRRWAHGPLGDEEPMAPPVLCWFELRRELDASGRPTARFVKHTIDDDSGVGTQFWTGDLNGDGKPDIAVANKHGVFVFEQR
ncbi:MAG: FG-GAP repeat domain-containing protein [Phycisphaerales bacterium]